MASKPLPTQYSMTTPEGRKPIYSGSDAGAPKPGERPDAVVDPEAGGGYRTPGTSAEYERLNPSTPQGMAARSAKREAVAGYVNQQQAGLVASGLESARENRATSGRGMRMVQGYLNLIQDAPATKDLAGPMQEAMATRQYMLGEKPTSKKAKSISEIPGTPESVARELKSQAVGSIAGRSILGNNPAGGRVVSEVRDARVTSRSGPVGGVRGRSFGADVAGIGGIEPRLKSEDDEITRVTPGDQPASGQPLRSTQTPSALAGGLGTGRGDDRRVMPASTGYPVRTQEQRLEAQSENLSDAMKGHVTKATSFIESHVKEHGAAPSTRVLGEGIGVSQAMARKIMATGAMKSQRDVSEAATRRQEKKTREEEIEGLYPKGSAEDTKISQEPLD